MTDYLLSQTDETHDPVALYDMGDGTVILSTVTKEFGVDTISMSYDQLSAAVSLLRQRYDLTEAAVNARPLEVA